MLRAPAKCAADTAAMSRGIGARGSTTTKGNPRARRSTSCSLGSGGSTMIAPPMPGRDASAGRTSARCAASPALSSTGLPCSSSVSAMDETIRPK